MHNNDKIPLGRLNTCNHSVDAPIIALLKPETSRVGVVRVIGGGGLARAVLDS